MHTCAHTDTHSLRNLSHLRAHARTRAYTLKLYSVNFYLKMSFSRYLWRIKSYESHSILSISFPLLNARTHTNNRNTYKCSCTHLSHQRTHAHPLVLNFNVCTFILPCLSLGNYDVISCLNLTRYIIYQSLSYTHARANKQTVVTHLKTCALITHTRAHMHNHLN